MHFSGDANKTGNANRRAAIFVDYDNLFLHLYERMGPRSRPDDVITEVVQELKRYLLQDSRTSTAVVAAYADFSEMHGNGQRIQRGLYLHGIEPRFVPGAIQRNASEIQLCLDAAETLYNRQDIGTIAILTGDRPYLPLVQHCNRRGSRALIATFSPPSSAGQSSHVDEDVFLPAINLLGDTTRRSLSSPRPVHRPVPPPPPAPRKSPVDYMEIEHPGARRALQIIDEHFGQYPEIYLTPLLRKLSELLDDDRYDPKSLISELENAGAVWLEKRRGFPYDYTVLIIDAQHPDVQELQQRDHRAVAPAAVSYDEGARYAEPYPEERDEYDDPNEYDEDYEDEYDDDTEPYPGGSGQGSIYDSGDNSY